MKLVVEQETAVNRVGQLDAPRDTGISSIRCERPRSASGTLTGAAGVIAAVSSAVLLRGWAQAGTIKALAVLIFTAGVMIAVDLLVYRVHRNAGREMAQHPKRRLDVLKSSRSSWASG